MSATEVTNPDERQRLREQAEQEIKEEQQEARDLLSTKARLEQQYEQRRVTVAIGGDREDVEPIPVEFRPLDGDDARAVTELSMRLLSMGEHETIEGVLDAVHDLEEDVSALLGEYSVDDDLDTEFWHTQFKLDERVDILKQVSSEADVDEDELKNLLDLP